MMREPDFTPDWFSKPGDTLKALLRRRDISPWELGNILEGGMATVRGILDGSVAIDADIGSQLADAVGGTTDFWLRRQGNYEVALERAVDVAEHEADAWLERVPAPPRRYGKKSAAPQKDQLRDRLAFFNVASLGAWHSRYGHLASATRFRRSASHASNAGAVLLWLRRGELEAELIPTKVWAPSLLRERLEDIRRLSRLSQPEKFVPALKQILAECGVALAIVRTPAGCYASGASRLIAPDKAMILLSFRYRADDQFWFTVFHEIAHLLIHEGKPFVDSDETIEVHEEREANDFAANCIVPADRVEELIALQPNRIDIIKFSRSVGVSPGMIVGQMQHKKVIEPSRMNSLKRHWTWERIAPALV